MKTPILNRNFEHPSDGWYQIEVPGEHVNRQSGVTQVIDDEAVTSIVNRFNAEADAYQSKHGTPFPGMLIDHEHFKYQADKETVAYGWLMRLQNRSGTPFGQVRWTNTGKPAIDGGDYRFFSSEYDPKDLQILNRETKRVRPLRLDGLSLTNDPNNKGSRPITNRSGDLRPCAPGSQCPDCHCALNATNDVQVKTCPQCKNDFAGSGETADSQQKTIKNKMKNIAVALGLDANTDEQGIVTVVTKLSNRGDITVADLKTLRQEHADFKTQNQTLLGEQVDTLLTAYGVTDQKIINRLKPVLAAGKDLKDREELLADFGFKPLEAGKSADAGTGHERQNKLFNRDTRPPGGKAAESSGVISQETVTKITNRAAEIRKASPSMSVATAMIQAQQEFGVKIG